MRVTDMEVVAASKASWLHMFKGDPLKDYDLHMKNSPEIVMAHERVVRAIFEANFDAELSVRLHTNGQQGFDDLFETGQEFRKGLIAFLKMWKAKNQ